MAENSVLLSRADSAVISRDFALAARLYSTLLKETPNDKDLLARLGNVYIKSGDDEKALPVFQQIQAANPNDTEVLLTLGGVYRRTRRYDESIKVLNEALNAGAKQEQAYYNLGFTYKLMGKYEDAIDCFETVVTLNSTDVLAYNHLGTLYELKGDHESAIAAYNKALNVDPNHPIIHLNLAKTFTASNNIVGAIRGYEAALRYKPGWDEAYVDYTALLLKLGRLKEAENLGEQGIALNAHNARLQALLGDIYMAESDYETAEQKYNDSIQIDPGHTATLTGLARSLEAQGKNNEAIDTIQKARELSPDDDTLIKQSASINLSAKKLAAASKDIKELFDIDKDDLETLDLAGQYYICTDDEVRAEKVYKKIENSDADYKVHLSNASNRYKQKGNYEKAENYINKYLDKKPNDVQGLISLAMIEERMGKTEMALANYAKAVASDATNRLAKLSSQRLAQAISTQKAIVQDQLEKQAEVEEQKNLPPEINMGEEAAASKEEFADDDVNFDENDFDFEAFGKSPLLDNEYDEIDFGDLAANQAQIEEEEEKFEAQPELELEPEEVAPKIQQVPAEENDDEKKELEEKMAHMAEENAKLRAAQEEAARKAAEEAAKRLAEQQEAARKAAEEAAKRLAEQQEAALQQAEETAKKLAEQQAALEEAARKLAEEQEAVRKAAEEEAEKQEEEKPQDAFSEAMKKMGGLIPAIENILKKDCSNGRDFTNEIQLFKTLRALSEALPELERQKFLQSRMRVTLDYLISALEGEPGLLKTSVALRKSGMLTDIVPEEEVQTDYTIEELARIVIGDMKSLSEELPEDDLRIALNKLADDALEY